MDDRDRATAVSDRGPIVRLRGARCDEIPERFIPAAQSQNLEQVSAYPALRIEQTGLTGTTAINKIYGGAIATAENRWAGVNRAVRTSPFRSKSSIGSRASGAGPAKSTASVGAPGQATCKVTGTSRAQ